jgi:hypothetical protein
MAKHSYMQTYHVELVGNLPDLVFIFNTDLIILILAGPSNSVDTIRIVKGGCK